MNIVAKEVEQCGRTLIVGRNAKFEHVIKAAPYSWIEKITVICRSDQKTRRRPIIHFLEQDRNQPLQFAYVALVIALFGNCIKLVKQ